MTFHALVIEPDVVQRRRIRETLLFDNWNVSEASSMEEAIQLIERHSWSMIFCHMNEKGDEVTLLRALKRKVGDSIPIIMTAAQITPQAVLKTILNGAFNFIGKPYGESEIRELSRLVRGRLQAAERESNNCTQNAMRESDFTSAASQFEIVGKGKAITKVATEMKRARNSKSLFLSVLANSAECVKNSHLVSA